jgi:hypothetical protein
MTTTTTTETLTVTVDAAKVAKQVRHSLAIIACLVEEADVVDGKIVYLPGGNEDIRKVLNGAANLGKKYSHPWMSDAARVLVTSEHRSAYRGRLNSAHLHPIMHVVDELVRQLIAQDRGPTANDIMFALARVSVTVPLAKEEHDMLRPYENRGVTGLEAMEAAGVAAHDADGNELTQDVVDSLVDEYFLAIADAYESYRPKRVFDR